MNDERPIEKLLRRYAKKRRDASPEPPGLEMHPATRRLLQGEVKRQFPKSAAQEKSVAPFWKNWWPRLVWAVPVLLVLLVGVWGLIGPGKKPAVGFELAKSETLTAPAEMAKKSPMAGASSADDSKSLATTTAAPAPLAAAAPAWALNESSLAYSDLARAEAPVNQPLRPLAKSLEVDRNRKPADETLKLEANSTLALPPPLAVADQESRQKPARAPASEVASAKRTDNLGLISRASGGGGAASVATVPVIADGFAAGQESKQNIDRSGKSVRFTTFAKNRETSPVLKNFQVTQNGNELRVIDSDGSTYAGSVVLAAADKDFQGAGEFKEKSPAPQRDYRRSSQPAGAVTQDKAQAAQLYFFRVTGTNRTLQQPVIFTGNFVTLTNLQPETLTAGGLAGETRQTGAPTPAPALFNSSINGRAQLGGGRELEINAQPVKP